MEDQQYLTILMMLALILAAVNKNLVIKTIFTLVAAICLFGNIYKSLHP